MKIFICGLKEIPKLYGESFAGVVSIGGPGDDAPDFRLFKSFPTRILRLEFDDLDDDSPNILNQMVDSGFIYPTTKDMNLLIRFARSFPSIYSTENILFHCHAGISRSTAAAFIFLATLGMKKEDAWATVMTVRPIAQPNSLMIKLASREMPPNLLPHPRSLSVFAAKKLNFDNFDTNINPALINT